MTTATTIRDTVEAEIRRVFGWECAVHNAHDGSESQVHLGERHDPAGNSGDGVGHYDLDKLAAILPTLPDYDPSLINEDGERYADTSAAWSAIEPAQVLTWVLEMRDDGGSTETAEFDHEPDEDEIAEACREWARGGEWGDDGAAVEVWWTLSDDDGDEIDEGHERVEIEPEHESLIKAAARGAEICGTDPDDHDWTSDGEGGCTENPGVWSTGGTSHTFASHCRTCGLHRTERTTGSQRNPGEHDTVSYRMLDDEEIAWHRAHGSMDEADEA